ncbi:uncharacterized protein K02A2.6-like [Eupeodes corollae]|uniref:uncharacterized protein K02A2.6-like n=1 Tax=Eupeodes corollae TaxID=290404 RepID=UPI0024933523|nr:uncharacterized protein K02A2.6-like [Eupeodes corollae]
MKKKKALHRIVAATTLDCSEDDPRPYVTVEIFGTKIRGLLDSGASLSCLGKVLVIISTADGQRQSIVGMVTAQIHYKGKVDVMDFFIVPSLTQQLYLGVDFWRLFQIAPNIISEISLNTGIVNKLDTATKIDLNDEEHDRLRETIARFPSFTTKGLGKTNLVEHFIDTGDATPIKQRHYPISPAIQALVYEELDRMLSLGVIEESSSAWSSPVVLVRKPGKNRLCLDFRKVNLVTKKNASPIAHIEGLLARLSETHFISSVDLKDAYWQIPLEQSSREKTAFTVPGRPLYQFKVMPFGLSNAAQTLTYLMNLVVPTELRDQVFVYLDDLLVISKNFEEHIRILEVIGKRLLEAGLTINVEKSKFCFKELQYLGYVVGQGCLKPDPAKVSAILEFPVPKTMKQVRRFLGMAGWYRRFVNNFSTLAAPLTDTLKKGKKFNFDKEAETAFEAIKTALTSDLVLTNPDFSKEFIILCDASASGIGCVLCQKDESGNERPIYYFSQKLNSAQRNYSVTERECLAAVKGIQKFRPYVEGYRFTVVTDHSSLKWLMSLRDPTGRLARWSLKLQGFDFGIEHRKGTLNVVPDALSRVYEVDTLHSAVCPPESMSTNTDVLHIDLEDPSFKSDEYLQIIHHIGQNKDQLPDLQVSDGFVYKKVRHCTGNPLQDDLVWKIWVPAALTNRLISLAHCPARASHGGITKTLYKLRQQFFWPNMASHVRQFIENCEVCKTTKAPNITLRAEMGKSFSVDRPFQHLYIDFLGPYPRSKAGNTQIFIVLDQLTKFVLIKPIRKANATSVIKFLQEDVFLIFGVPESILSDNGSQFIGKEFSKMTKIYGITHYRTAVYSPQANASERVNRSILAAIRAYIDPGQTNWDLNLSSIGSALRSTIHSAIGMSPYEALFGHRIIEHGSDYRLLRKLGGLNHSEIDWLPKVARMNVLHTYLKAALERSHESYEKTYNLRSRVISYKVGDVLYKRNFVLSDATKHLNAKLSPKFVKVTVCKIIGNNLYEVLDSKGHKT